jgi:hypothetical protein
MDVMFEHNFKYATRFLYLQETVGWLFENIIEEEMSYATYVDRGMLSCTRKRKNIF